MYCKYFGFTEKPFDITPDHRFLYMTPGHREALASLLYGIRERRGLIVLTGGIGTGKTTLLRAALHQLGPKTKWAYVFNSDLRFLEVLAMILDDLRLLKPQRLTKFAGLRLLNNFAIRQTTRGGNVVVMVDVAQSLSAETIENLRMITNLESDTRKLIQLVLAGQNELEDKLNLPASRAFVQRICLRRLVAPLDEKYTYDYIRHRLAVAGFKGILPFTPKALHLIWLYSHGVPRTVNILCDNVLLTAFGLERKKVNGEMVTEAAGDLRLPEPADAGKSSRVIKLSRLKAKAR
jgi:general secretion pathway protein A